MLPTSFGIGAVIGILWLWPVGPIVKKKMEAKRSARVTEQARNATPSPTPINPAASVRSLGSSIGRQRVRPTASIRSIGSIGSSIGSHMERYGQQLAEYDPEERAIHFAIAESVKSVKLTIDSEAEEAESDITEHATNINENAVGAVEAQQTKKPKKKNFLIRFEEATYKQNLEEQCFQESSATQQCWQNATQYDSDVEQLFSKYFR